MDDDVTNSASSRAMPLEKATFRYDGGGPDAGKEIPALDPRWCDQNRQFPEYFALEYDTKVYVRPWLRNGEELVDACKWLLQLPYHKFWSQIVYGDRQLRVMIDSYLSLCPRWYNSDQMKTAFFSRNRKVKRLMHDIFQAMYFVLLRMTTTKEAPRSSYMSLEFHGKLIWDHGIFDIARLMDLCVVYGHSNEKLVHRMMELVFKSQPKLYDQLTAMLIGVAKILTKCSNNVERLVGRKVKILRDTTSQREERLTGDILLYVVDLTYSLSTFAKVWPKAMEYYHQTQLSSKIPKFVEETVGDLLQDLYAKDLRGGFRLKLNESIGQLGAVREELVSLWRSILQHNFLDKVLIPKNDTTEETECLSQYVDEVLGLLTECINEKTFLRLYASKYSLSNDIDNWITRRIELDMGRVQYISEAINAAFDSELSDHMTGSVAAAVDSVGAAVASVESMSIRPTSIVQFRELFPDFDRSQAEVIIGHYGGDVEAAIHAVLTGALPAECPQLPKEEDEKVTEAVESEMELVPLRESSKRGPKNVTDENEMQALKPFYERYQMETEEDEREALVGVQRLNAPLPVLDAGDDDEYDDTYDANIVDLSANVEHR